LRPIFPSGMSSRGGLTLGFFVLLAAGLFFIPEIIHFKRALSSAPANERAEGEEVAEVEEVAEEAELIEESVEEVPEEVHSSPDALGRVLTKFKQGDFNEKTDPQEIATQDIAGLNPEEQQIASAINSPNLTWKKLSSKSVVARVSKAHSAGGKLLKSLDEKYKRARWALVTYVNALGGFIRGGVKEMNPKDYLDYLTRLDLAVTRAMIEDQVRKAEYSQWKDMSLVPLLSQATVAAREAHNPPFVTDIVVTSVSIRERAANKKFAAHAELAIRGYILGPDAQELQIARSNILMESLALRGKGEAKPFTFNDKMAFGDPAYTFRVLDGAGHGLDKVYRFVSTARRFPKKLDGLYRVPSIPRVNPRQYMPYTLDKIFFTGIAKGNAFRPSSRGKRSDLAGYTGF
jgi:hypothetical protein